jgi:hypothetical protein
MFVTNYERKHRNRRGSDRRKPVVRLRCGTLQEGVQGAGGKGPAAGSGHTLRFDIHLSQQTKTMK